MKHRNLSELTNEELLQEVKKNKSASLINALLIGFLIGIVFYSIVKNGSRTKPGDKCQNKIRNLQSKNLI